MNTIGVISYYVNSVLAYIGFYLAYLYEEFREFALIIKIAAVSLTVTGLLVFGCMIRLFFRVWKRHRSHKLSERIEKRYGEGVTYILSSESRPDLSRRDVLDLLDLSNEDIGRVLKKNREKMAFSRMVYNIRISESSALGRRRNLHVLLNIFGIPAFLEDQVNKGSERVKVESIYMIRAFKLHINQWMVNLLMNSKRNRLRRLVMYASALSSTSTDLEYFESEFFDENCCIYDEIQLGYVLQRRVSLNRKIPNLAHWAGHQKNPSTQLIFIRLMRQFDQKEYCEDLVELFNTGNHDLMEEIARTWGYLHYEEGEELLSETLTTQNDDVKVTFMHALARMATGKSVDALVDGYRESGNFHVRFEALRCLYNYGEVGQAKFEELRRTASENDKPLFAFFRNEITLEQIELAQDDLYEQQFGENIYSVL